MSDIREKLADLFEDGFPESVVQAKKNAEKYLASPRETRNAALFWADTVLAKFDVTEKKPRYYLLDCVQEVFCEVWDELGEFPPVRFHGYGCASRARAYRDWLNSREESK